MKEYYGTNYELKLIYGFFSPLNANEMVWEIFM